MPEKKAIYSLVLFFILILCFNIGKPVMAQDLTNLDVLYRLSDSVIVSLENHIPAGSKNIYFKTSLPGAYSVFENRIIAKARESKLNVLTIPDSSDAIVSISIDNAKVSYKDIFRESIFSSYKVKREILLHGSFIISGKGSVKDSQNFNYIHEDTVDQNEIKDLENQAVPFTRGEVPSEPLFSSLLEPVIALGTAAAVIYLFFSVRSK